MKFGHTTSQYGQSFFPKTISPWNRHIFVEALSLAESIEIVFGICVLVSLLVIKIIYKKIYDLKN